MTIGELRDMLEARTGPTKDHFGGDGFQAHCPGPRHKGTDDDPSLSIDPGDKRVVMKCFVGCEEEEICAELGIKLSSLYYDKGGRGASSSPPPQQLQQLQQLQQSDTSPTPPTGCTLATYAEAKLLPIGFLKMQGVSEIPSYDGGSAVRILYRDEAGMEDGAQFRIALTKSAEGDMRFKWRKGSKATLYGRWRLPEARRRKAPSIVLAEGASDAQTLGYHGVDALGLPGANTWNEARDARYFDGFEVVYVVVEPDTGGETVKKWLAKSRIRERVRRLSLGEHKDPSDLHIACRADRAGFKVAWERALAEAQPWSELKASERKHETDAAWNACAELAQKADILSAFVAALAARGGAGEVRAAKLLYLALTSRVFDRPASVIVKAPSSTGKSFVAEKVAEFFPPEAYSLLSAMSERALIYGDDDLRHRFLSIAEANGLQGDMRSYIIRTLLSEGRIVYPTVEKTSEGLVGRTITKDGPTGLIVGTTNVSLHPENETRHLSLTMTDTPEQTRAVFRVLAREARKGKGAHTDGQAQLDMWHALQRWLASIGDPDVDIPYAEALAELIPPIAVRLRRDFKTLLILIKSHAFLHQKQRPLSSRGRIVATPADYQIVRGLVAELVSEGVSASVSATVRQTVGAVEELLKADEGLKDTGVSITALAAHLKLDKSVVSRRVKVATAEDKGYLRNLEQRPHQPARLVLGVDMPKDEPVLPTPEQVEAFTLATVASAAPVAEGPITRPPSPSSNKGRSPSGPERQNGSNGYAGGVNGYHAAVPVAADSAEEEVGDWTN